MRAYKCDGIGEFRPFQCPDEDDYCCVFFHLQLKFDFFILVIIRKFIYTFTISIMYFKALQNAFLMEEHV